MHKNFHMRSPDRCNPSLALGGQELKIIVEKQQADERT
jgi:hypothetical protein